MFLEVTRAQFDTAASVMGFIEGVLHREFNDEKLF